MMHVVYIVFNVHIVYNVYTVYLVYVVYDMVIVSFTKQVQNTAQQQNLDRPTPDCVARLFVSPKNKDNPVQMFTDHSFYLKNTVVLEKADFNKQHLTITKGGKCINNTLLH